MNNKEFRASWGRRLSVISGLTTLILLLFVMQTIARLPNFDSATVIWRLGLVILIGVSSALFFIRKYSINSDMIKIHHPGWSTALKVTDLTGVERVPVEAKGGIGLFGIWGIYSITGIARNSTYGFHKRYITNPLHAVALKFGKKTVIVSPDNPEEFIKEVQLHVTKNEDA